VARLVVTGKEPGRVSFFQHMIAVRKARAWIARSHYWREDVHWYGANGPVDPGPASRTLAYCLHGRSDLYLMSIMKSHRVPLSFSSAEPWRSQDEQRNSRRY
jgi:glycogen operon protein